MKWFNRLFGSRDKKIKYLEQDIRFLRETNNITFTRLMEARNENNARRQALREVYHYLEEFAYGRHYPSNSISVRQSAQSNARQVLNRHKHLL